MRVLILVVVDNGLVHYWFAVKDPNGQVLILVVVDNGLVLALSRRQKRCGVVLILVVVDNGLVLPFFNGKEHLEFGLNPCCSGQWSRTFLSPFIYIN